MRTLTQAWQERLAHVLRVGRGVSPRGMLTVEDPQATIEFDMNDPVLMCPSRKLNFQFMLAEAWWIVSGKGDVESIAKYNKNISQFSDDGVSFAGAYGPKIKEQLDYVITSLMSDKDTRQAGLTLWNENPEPSKDIPCTIAMWFQLRESNSIDRGTDGLELNMHVFMRSSDIWLGLPYDCFSFTMVAATVCSLLNHSGAYANLGGVKLGDMYLTAASSHLYEKHFDSARELLKEEPKWVGEIQPLLPKEFYDGTQMPEDLLFDLKDTAKDSEERWWNLQQQGS